MSRKPINAVRILKDTVAGGSNVSEGDELNVPDELSREAATNLVLIGRAVSVDRGSAPAGESEEAPKAGPAGKPELPESGSGSK